MENTNLPLQLNKKQRLLLIIIATFWLLSLLSRALFTSSVWTNLLPIINLIPLSILFLGTNQKVFQVRKQWNTALFILLIFCVSSLQTSLTYFLHLLGLESFGFVFLAFLFLVIPFSYFYGKNLKKRY